MDSGDGPLRALGFEELGDRGLEAGYVAKQRALSEVFGSRGGREVWKMSEVVFSVWWWWWWW